MFLPFIPRSWYEKTYIFWIQGTIFWYWIFFITFVIWIIPNIGWWRYVREKSLIINIRYCFLNSLLGNYRIVINFVRLCKITIFQAKNSKTRKNNLEKYISPFPWLIITNVPNSFGEFGISRNTDEFSRWYSVLKKFSHPQVSLHHHKISNHSSLISNK